MSIIKCKDSNGGICYFNLDHYFKVREARTQCGLGELDDKLNNVEIKEHPFLGKYIYCHSSKKWYLIEKINKQWWAGYYYGMLLNCNDSHAFVYFENINSIHPIIIKFCEEFKENFDLHNLQESI